MPQLKYGYTTGSCAAAAAKAAVTMLLGGESIESVDITLPKGDIVNFKIENTDISDNYVICSVKKYSGDDPDITDGIYIYAKALRAERGVNITGGIGIGIVTKKGLDQPVGEYAINSSPRKSIIYNVEQVCDKYEYHKGINIEISAPQGVELAAKTFNPRLGIAGGISILGTTGIVEPMSQKAILDTIDTELNVIKQYYDYAVGVLGNYGEEFAVNKMGIKRERIVMMSNFVGDTISMAEAKGFKGLYIIGHIGKMIKLAGGIYNTHSKYADCRMELMTACAVEAGADYDILCQLLKCNTTDEAVDLLIKNDIIKSVMDRLLARIEYYLGLKAVNMKIGAAVFSNKYGILCQSGESK